MTSKPGHTPPDVEAPVNVIEDRLSVDSNDGPNLKPEAPRSQIITERPDWFNRALARPYKERTINHQGCDVKYLEWGDQSKPGILFVHGNGAHAKWFHFIAPLLTRDYHVASIHLSGMGDSGWRDTYTRVLFAEELMAVCDHANLGPKPIIIGHSFGGMVTLVAGHRFQDRLGGIVLVDFTVRPKDVAEDWFTDRPPPRPTRVYQSFDEARSRFRLAPPQPCANQYIVDYIAETSLRKVEDGWTWKFDPSIYNGFSIGPKEHEDMFRSMKIPVAGIMGRYSWASDDDRLTPMKEMRPEAPNIVIEDANHHILLDQPVAFVAAIASLLQTWPNPDANGKEGPSALWRNRSFL